MSKPLVTFALVSYNQEKFIREAVEGAFAQTYSPLEIILSDDCSTDRTFEIMAEMAGAYRGPHNVRLHKSQTNLGLCPLLDGVVKLAQGEWIVIAAGDDISLPDRVAEHMEIAGSHADVFSSFLAPVPFGEPAHNRVPPVTNKIIRYPESLKANGGGVLGATQAFRTVTWKVFGDLGPEVIQEDWIIPFRSSLLGCVVWKDCPGIRYRVHGSSITAEYWSRVGNGLPSSKQIRMEIKSLQAFQRDLETALDLALILPSQARDGLRWLAEALATNEAILRCVEAGNLGDWFSSAMRILSSREFVGTYGRRLDIVKRSFGKTVKTPSLVKNKN